MPHIHVLITCGAFTPEGEFLELPEFDMERLLDAWQDTVFGLYLAEEGLEVGVNFRGKTYTLAITGDSRGIIRAEQL